MGLDLVFTLQNMRSENQDIYVPFYYETKTAFALLHMPSDNQDISVHFFYEIGHHLYIEEYTL